MFRQNSSKSYPPIYGLQNKTYSSVEVQIRGESVSLTSNDFFQLTQLIQVKNIADIKNQGLQSLVFNQKNLAIAHILLYYCIKVNLKIQIQGLQSFYLKQLGNLYVASRFNIQIGKYSRLCSLFVGIHIRKFYGRLATNSYIETIISQLSPQRDKKYKTILSQNCIPRRDNCGRQKQLAFEQSQQNLCEDLMEDLKNIFQKNTNCSKKQKISSYSCKAQNNQEVEQQKTQHNNGMGEAQKKYYMNFFPNRIFNTEKSAIFERMHPSSGPNYKLMRKKRFNDTKIQKMLYSTFTNTEQKQNNLENLYDTHHQNHKQKNKLFNYSSAKTNDKFKSVSQELDKIRNVITKGKKKIQNHQFSGTTTQPINDKQKEYLQLKQKVQKQQPQQRTKKNELFQPEYDCKNQVVSLIRKQKNGNRGKKGNEQSKRSSGDFHGMIFKNLANGNEGGNVNRIFHSDCQNRLFQYKNEFRKFMKVHFFVIDDQ